MKEKKYIIKIEMDIHVVAKNLSKAKEMVKRNNPWVCISGVGGDGYHSIETKRKAKIISCTELKAK